MVAGDQRLVHTPFVPSGYWSACAPLVWNEGFPTLLGGLSMFTNPVKAPDIRFSSSQFPNQHPGHEKAMVVGGSRQETLDLGFVLLGTRQQGVPVIFRELVLPDSGPGFPVDYL
ncbi:unnamed protein product [Schistosoma curassoni]|uniref:DUF2088 domain-containing protein n=1 Tax=Schistosoma curassoni TaxID=6186 RepID=A0A183JXP7_9TREM|nr:unnamed protein product [Schistosoma curassoni]